jgi:hypothetical protein
MTPTKRTMFVIASMLIAASMLFIAGCGTTAPVTENTTDSTTTEIAKYKVGDTVVAEWVSGFWYPATVIAVNGTKYDLGFDDGSSGDDYEEAKLKPLPATLDLKVGDRVLASWTGTGKLYPGSVQEVKTDGVIVKWDDGSEPSEVKFGKIIKE